MHTQKLASNKRDADAERLQKQTGVMWRRQTIIVTGSRCERRSHQNHQSEARSNSLLWIAVHAYYNNVLISESTKLKAPETQLLAFLFPSSEIILHSSKYGGTTGETEQGKLPEKTE